MDITNSKSMNQTKTKIEIKNLTKIYHRGEIKVNALNNLSANFNSGEISVIIGASGCGKTTLLNSIGRFVNINSGSIIINDKNIAEFDESQIDEYHNKEIGFVFQFFNLIPELTAHENVELPLEIAKYSVEEKKNRVDELFRVIGLENRKDHFPNELSGGEQQRIGIAMALANNPEIILCDEPTGELDSKSKKEIMKLLRSIIETSPEKSILIVSHDNDMRYIADKIYHIRDGIISYIEETGPENKHLYEKFINDDKPNSIYHAEIEREIKETIYFLQEKLKNLAN